MAYKIRDKLLKLHREEGRVLVDFVILPTEILTITQVQAGDSVYKVAAPLGNQVAKWVQEHERVRSPLLARPYARQLLESDDEIRQEVRMMSWRPVLKGEAYAPDRDRNGALRSALGGNAARLFDPMPLLRLFGTGVNPSRDALRDWLRKPPSDEEWRAWELSRGLRLAIGTSGPYASAKQVPAMAAAFIAAGGSDSIEGALELLEIWVGTRLCPPAPVDLLHGIGALPARGRGMVARLAQSLHLCPAAAVARHFALARSSLSEQMTKSNLRSSDQDIVKTPLKRILAEAQLLKKQRQLRENSGAPSVGSGNACR